MRLTYLVTRSAVANLLDNTNEGGVKYRDQISTMIYKKL